LRWAAELQQKIQRECLLTAQVEAATRELQRLASLDSLTQIANRHYFNEYLQREWNRLQKYQLSLSLILVNVYTNADEQIKDEYLRQIAETIRKCKQRGADLVARFDDAEFAVILPNTPAAAALQIAETIFSAVNATVTIDSVTLSLGVTSVIPSSESSANKLIATAAKALSQAKLAESDRIVVLS
jgi:diguanylate cyclase (GGDEF)-like protein